MGTEVLYNKYFFKKIKHFIDFIIESSVTVQMIHRTSTNRVYFIAKKLASILNEKF